MKKLLYSVYIGLMLPFALACEKQNIEPTGEYTEIISDTLEAKAANCTNYFYFSKDNLKLEFGIPQGEMIFVGFTSNSSSEAHLQLLSRFPAFKEINGEISAEGGIVKTIYLQPGSTCFDAERLRKELEKHDIVRFACPTFGNLQTWRGLTNDFIVFIENEDAYPKLQKLVKKTKTKISLKVDDNFYILSADKHSKGNIFDICTTFNKESYIVIAEPDANIYPL